jgi:hypothetical protein
MAPVAWRRTCGPRLRCLPPARRPRATRARHNARPDGHAAPRQARGSLDSRAGSRHLDPLEELFPWDEHAAPRAAAASQTPGDAAWLSGIQPQWVRRRKPRAEATVPALAASLGAGTGAGAGERSGALGVSGTQLELTASELEGPRSDPQGPGGAAPAAADAAAAERADAEDTARRVSAVCRMAVWRAWRGDPSGLDPIYAASLHEDACALLAECGASPDPSPPRYKPDAHLSFPRYKPDAHLSFPRYKPDAHLSFPWYKPDAHLSFPRYKPDAPPLGPAPNQTARAHRRTRARAARLTPRRAAIAPFPPSLPYKVDTSRPSLRTDWTHLVPPLVLTTRRGQAALYNCGNALRAAGRFDEAAAQLRAALVTTSTPPPIPCRFLHRFPLRTKTWCRHPWPC